MVLQPAASRSFNVCRTVPLARIVLQAPMRSNTKSLLRQLHWLPVQQRITCKLTVLTFKVRITSMPTHLGHHIVTRDSVRTLRSTTSTQLSEPFVRTDFARRAFCFSAQHTWNALPKTVKWRLHMTIGLQTGMQTRCDDRFANRSSCVNGQIHSLQTGRRTDRKNQTCLILAIRQTTRAMCKRICDRYDDRFANLCKYLAAHWLTLSMELTSRVDIASVK